MPIYKRVVNVSRADARDFEIEQMYGPHRFGSSVIRADTSLAELFDSILRLTPGDRVELNFLDESNPTARIGRPRAPGAGWKPKEAVPAPPTD